jgi:competence protein ComEC
MLVIYFGSRWYRRQLAVTHALGLSLVGVLLLDPFAPLAPGAWLSFGAVAIILLAVAGPSTTRRTYRGIRARAARSDDRPRASAAHGVRQRFADIAGRERHRHSVVHAGARAHRAARRLCRGVWLPAGAWILALPAHVLHWTWPLLLWLAKCPLAVWHFPQPPVAAFVAMVIGVVLLVAPGIWPTRLAGVVLCLPVMFHRVAGPAVGNFEVAVLDVGQGLAVVVRTRAHVLVYDAGPAFPTGRDAGELAVLPYLRYYGVRQVDALVVSHGDLDHRGGANSVLAGVPVARVLAGPSVGPLARPRERCRRGQRWIWDGVQFEMLHPARSARASDNDSSCVLRVHSSAGSVLLAGDVEAVAESEIVDSGLPRTTVVIVPHHGSRTSSTAPFVAAAHPCACAGVGRISQSLGVAAAGSRRALACRRRTRAHDGRQRRDRDHVARRSSAARARISADAGGATGIADWRHAAICYYAALITRPTPDIHVCAHVRNRQSRRLMMGPIILASIVAAAIMLERLWTLQSKRVLPAELTDKVWRWVEQGQIQDKHIAALEQNSPLAKCSPPDLPTATASAPSSRRPSRTRAVTSCTSSNASSARSA